MIGNIKRSPEPFSTASHSEPSILAESPAYDLLIRELSLYAEGFIGGRSLLISGHRGSGKTTLVYKAVQDLSRRFREEHQPFHILLVPLHGPDLLLTSKLVTRSLEAKDVTRNNQDTSEDRQDNTKQTPKAETANEPIGTQRVLIQITIALYRSLANEISYTFQKRIEEDAGGARSDLLELAAQLRLELDNLSNISVLREIWKKADLLETGALFDKGVFPTSMGQGVRELVALSTAAQAFRVVSGKIGGQEIHKFDAQNMQQVSVTNQVQAPDIKSSFLGNQMKDFLYTLLGLLAGSVVGAGVIYQTTNTLLAAVLAVFTALATIFSLNFVTSRSRTQVVSKELSFIRDYSVTTLSRELPILINRLREAKIAPVFIVDELDKITLPFDHIGILVSHLKQFVTERSFFCFLTDRNYYEYLEYRSRTLPFPKEHTFFTHRIFVLYQPKNLRQFLMALLQPIENPYDYEDVIRDLNILNDTGFNNYENQFRENCELFSYILLHWARLHPFNLRRELSKFVRFSSRLPKDSLVAIPENLLSDLGYRFTIMFQVAIEWLLSQKELSNRLNHDPYFGQYTYDALYYSARSWANGDQILELSEKAFRQYLDNQVGENYLYSERKITTNDRDTTSFDETSPGEEILENNDPFHGKNHRNEGFYSLLSSNDILFLYGQARELVSLLLEPEKLVEKIQEALSIESSYPLWRLLELIPTGQPDLRLLEPVSQDRFRWRYDNYGRLLSGIEIQTTTSKSLSSADLINEFSTSIKELTEGQLTLDNLANSYNVLAVSPQWSNVEAAIIRLQEYNQNGQIYDGLEADQLIVEEYLNIILQRGASLGGTLALGTSIGQAAGGNSIGESMVKGLNALATLLDFKSMTKPAQIEEAINKLDTGFNEDIKHMLILNRDNLSTWMRNTNDLIDKKTKEIL